MDVGQSLVKNNAAFLKQNNKLFNETGRLKAEGWCLLTFERRANPALSLSCYSEISRHLFVQIGKHVLGWGGRVLNCLKIKIKSNFKKSLKQYSEIIYELNKEPTVFK